MKTEKEEIKEQTQENIEKAKEFENPTEVAKDLEERKRKEKLVEKKNPNWIDI